MPCWKSISRGNENSRLNNNTRYESQKDGEQSNFRISPWSGNGICFAKSVLKFEVLFLAILSVPSSYAFSIKWLKLIQLLRCCDIFMSSVRKSFVDILLKARGRERAYPLGLGILVTNIKQCWKQVRSGRLGTSPKSTNGLDQWVRQSVSYSKYSLSFTTYG